MASDILKISTQFTDDCIATQACKCERPSCGKDILPGDKRFYVAPDATTNRDGRYICNSCMAHYLAKPSTAARLVPTAATNSGSTGPSGGPVGTAVNLAVIRTMVNESQRRGAHTPQGRVTAVSQHISHPSSTALPSITNPSFFQGYFERSAHAPSVQSPSFVPPPSGYSSAHLQYQDERERWSSSAYKTPSISNHGHAGQIPLRARPKEQVRILLQVSYQVFSGKVEKTAIREGIPVDYEIRPAALADLIKSNLLQPLSNFVKGFPWDFSKMVIRETSSWQDILKVDPNVSYFQGRFLKVKTGAKSDGSLIFSAPKNPIEFSLIVDRDQWVAAEDFQENRSSQFLGQVPKRPVTPEISSKRKIPPSPEKIPSSAPSQPKRANISLPSSATAILSAATLQDIGSNAATAQTSFQPLNPDQIRKGILLGGKGAIIEQKKQFDQKITETVACFLINAIPFAELCGGDFSGAGQNKKIIDDSKYLGYLSYDKTELIGKGTFKTAHMASLEWVSASPAGGLGANCQTAIAVALKRPYDDTHSTGIKRFNFADESRKVLTEGTLLGWADSLLRFAYSFIDNFISGQTAKLPFNVPRLRFVRGAIAFVEKPLDRIRVTASPSTTSHRAAYLLEELLPVDQPFIKYIHNAEAVPLQTPEELGYEVGVFLCFIQHVQFVHTHGQAFISDFQGSGNLLTDPQVMTHPSLTDPGTPNDVLFGEGNVNSAFDAFAGQHQCNHYCEWFQLEKLFVEN